MKIYVFNASRLWRRFSGLVQGIALLLIVLTVFNVVNSAISEASAPPSEGESGRVIIIDAGHGGEDSGATGVDGVKEKDLNLSVANELGSVLSERGYTVVYTRTEDKMLYTEEQNIKGLRKINDLKNRCAVAEKYEDPIFISIHMNFFGAEKYSGLQVYYSDGAEESRKLASSIQAKVRETVQNDNDRVVKNGKGLYLLDNCSATTVIVECGFLSNAEECRRLSEKEYQKELSFAIFCGIIEYMEGQ